MGSGEVIPPRKEVTKRFAQIGNLFLGLLKTWKTTLLLILLVADGWRERFWTDSVMRFTCPLMLFLLSLPILDHYGFSFTRLFRKRKASALTYAARQKTGGASEYPLSGKRV